MHFWNDFRHIRKHCGKSRRDHRDTNNTLHSSISRSQYRCRQPDDEAKGKGNFTENVCSLKIKIKLILHILTLHTQWNHPRHNREIRVREDEEVGRLNVRSNRSSVKEHSFFFGALTESGAISTAHLGSIPQDNLFFALWSSRSLSTYQTSFFFSAVTFFDGFLLQRIPSERATGNGSILENTKCNHPAT